MNDIETYAKLTGWTPEKSLTLHEASHAVIAAWLRAPFGETSIVFDEETNSAGHVDGGRERPVQNLAKTPTGDVIWVRDARDLAQAERAIMVRFAGGIGQKMYGLQFDDQKDACDADDLAQARRLARQFNISKKQLDVLYRRTTKMLSRQRVYSALFSIFEWLLEKKRLSAKEVRAVVRGHRVGGMGQPLRRLFPEITPPPLKPKAVAAPEPVVAGEKGGAR